MNISWKKVAVNLLAVVVAAYLVLAMTAFNTPADGDVVCSRVDVSIADRNGFLNADEVKRILKDNGLYPLARRMDSVDIRLMEETLCRSPFVAEAQCYKAGGGRVCIEVEQRRPVVRVKADNGDDYYVDSNGGIMQNTKYVSDVVVATGCISQDYASRALTAVGNAIAGDRFWQDQVVQLNVLPDGTMEMVPRVGDNIVYLGSPAGIESKLHRLELFYRYGLSRTGWDKYGYISLEFDNQIICKKKKK